MVQDIKITPSGAGDKIPQMLFTGSGATAINMELNVQPDSRLSYESNEGEVFSISKGLQSGVIFAVKDISGLDQISVNASGDMHLAPYYGNVRVGATGVIHEDYALDVQGKGLRVGSSGTVLTRASAPGVTTDTLYNVAGSLYFDGSAVGGGSASAEATYASGQALSLTYASGLTATNASNISTNTSNISTNTTNITAATNTANYASGEAVSLNYASGVAAYASGNTANIDFGSNVQGDILYHNGTTFTRLAKGTDNHVLTMDGSNPGWEAAAAGGISWDGSTANGVATYKDADEATVESNLTFDGNTLTVATSSSSAEPTVIKGAASQTADLTSWQNSAGVSVAAMTPSGILNVYDIRTSGNEVAIGNGAKFLAAGAGVAIGTSANANGHATVSIGTGSQTLDNYSTAVGGHADCGDQHSVAIGYQSDAHASVCVAIGSWAEAGSGGVSVGQNANNGLSNGGGDSAVAIGYQVDAAGDNAIAVGPGTQAAGHSAIAIGHDATSPGAYGVAIGNAAVSSEKTWVIASGATAAAVGISGVFGSYAAIPNDQKLAVGGNVPTYTVDALGHGAMVRATGVIVGNSGIVLASNTPSVTTNTLYNDGGTLSFNGSAVGGAGGISWDGSTANGVATYKDADEATVESNLTFDGNTLTVATSSSSAEPTVIKGAASQTADLTSWQNSAGVSVAAMTPSGILNVYDVRMSGNQIILGAGANSKDAWGDPHSSTCVAIGPSAGASADAIAIGGGATATSGQTGSQACIAIGHNASATAKRAISIGNTSSTNGKHETVCIGNEADSFAASVAIGFEAIAGGSSETHSVAIGRRAKAVGVGALALGTREDQVNDNTNAIGNCAIAIGGGAQATEGTYVIASGNTAAAVAISGVYGSYMALPNDQKLAVGGNVPQYAIDVVTHSGVIRASGVKGHISTNADAATVTFDLNAATTHGVTLGGNRILAVSNAIVGDKFLTRLQQDATGSRTVTWFSHIKWAEGGTAPTLTTTAHKADLLGFLAASGDGTNIWYDGFVVGQNI